MSRNFEVLLEQLAATFTAPLPSFTSLVDDSRDVEAGSLFILRRGSQALGLERYGQLCQEALRRGATGILSDPELCPSCKDCFWIGLREPEKHLEELAKAFYPQAEEGMKIVGITGSNGKTTTSFMIEALAQSLGCRVGVLGTVSHRYPGYSEAARNTTPGIVKLYGLLDGMRRAGCTLVVMEVSSHALVQGRVDSLLFDLALWNNLGSDHLDFHRTREAYAQAKQGFFSRLLPKSFQAGKRPIAIYDLDQREVAEAIAEAKPERWGQACFAYSLEGKPEAQLLISEARWQNEAWQALASYGKQRHVLRLPLLGRYNLANANAALSAMLALGFDFSALCEALSRLPQLPGRMERVHSRPTVIVDFAHTAEALENALLALRSHMDGSARLLLVFGAGGDRDALKRPKMGAAAARWADFSLLTNDNPRSEDPASIAAAIASGFEQKSQYEIVLDRRQAIAQALAMARPQDYVLIAGKGHEKTQMIAGRCEAFDDVEEVHAYYRPQGLG